ncbi:MAG: zinc ribbon domain-containing protein [Euryarchaeota archaeon]|nr:zinc ribbon domain-containing protein [Euryarchaeota archaeon]MDE1879370.1 zinc ribbon domain-containing protein [Euryarchaeota archaeon]
MATVAIGPIFLGVGVLIVLVVVLILVWRVIVPMWVKRRQAQVAEGTAWIEDRAWNQIQAAKALADFLDREGTDIREAVVQIEVATGKYEMRRYVEAQRLAKEVTEKLAARRKRARETPGASTPKPVGKPIVEPEPEGPTHRDLARRVGDPDPEERPSPTRGSISSPPLRATEAGAGGDVEHDEEEGSAPPEEIEDGTITAERAKRPKDFMEARFMLTSLQNDLDAAPAERKQDPAVREARDWAQKSQASFDRKDYTESLRLAMRGRRRLGGAGISTISVGAGTVVEAPPEELSPTARRSSAPPPTAATSAPPSATAPTSPAMSCGRCGRVNNSGDRFCRGCGAMLAPPSCPRCHRPVEADDRFCHGCGSPLGG